MRTVTKRLSHEDVLRAEAVWAEYLQTHDVSDRLGSAAGIDPDSGRVWFGESILDVMEQQDAQGDASPLFFIRVGSDYYYRKGGRR
jgi:hypothetical protein